MEIIKYKKSKGSIYEVTLDNGETYKIHDEILLKYELLINRLITEKKLKTILSENEKMDAYYKAIKYLSTKMRSILEIKKYLEKYEYEKDNISYVIDKLKSEGYIDNERYAKAYINDQITLSLNGPKKICDSLMKLGLPSNVVENHINHINQNEWIKRIEKIVDKKARVNKNSEVLFKNKMYSHLIMLGYDSVMIKDILDSYKIDTSAAFIREANKVWSHLSNKYEDKEMEYRFKNKMLQKGFSYDDINNYLNKK